MPYKHRVLPAEADVMQINQAYTAGFLYKYLDTNTFSY